jgi:SAM-dependent methyltransferase
VTSLLPEPYYSEAQEVFRKATNQTELMLDHLVAHVPDLERLSVLSVGSGVGLFEMPMLSRLHRDGHPVSRFVGIDSSAHACAVLETKLQEAGWAGLDFAVIATPFEAYMPTQRFDLVVFNHVFEYLPGEPVAWAHKATELLAAGGRVLIFSPNRGGINQIYEEEFIEHLGAPPFFADDIERVLQSEGDAYAMESVEAACDLSLLLRDGEDPEQTKLLSFLTQRDCRGIPAELRQRYVDYYLSLRPPGSNSSPHPATLLVL